MSEISKIIETAAQTALIPVLPLPLAALIAKGLGELADILTDAKNPTAALARAKQNALADAEDAAAVATADAILKGQHK